MSKYDPALRNADGHFLGSEWTSLLDLPNTPSAVQAYLHTEQHYIDCVLQAFALCAVSSLRIEGLETSAGLIDMPEALLPESQALQQAAHTLRGEVSTEDAAQFVRACLRELVWGKLQSEDGFYLHIGYDFYLYMGHPSGSLGALKSPALFLEPMASPFA